MDEKLIDKGEVQQMLLRGKAALRSVQVSLGCSLVSVSWALSVCNQATGSWRCLLMRVMCDFAGEAWTESIAAALQRVHLHAARAAADFLRHHVFDPCTAECDLHGLLLVRRWRVVHPGGSRLGEAELVGQRLWVCWGEALQGFHFQSFVVHHVWRDRRGGSVAL